MVTSMLRDYSCFYQFRRSRQDNIWIDESIEGSTVSIFGSLALLNVKAVNSKFNIRGDMDHLY